MITDGLLLHLPFQGNFKDQTKYKNHASVTGADSFKFIAGPTGHANAFNVPNASDSNYITVANKTDYQANIFSLAFWLYIDTWRNSWASIVGKHRTNGFQLHRNNTSSTLLFDITSNLSTPSGTITTGVWNHIAVTRQGASVVWYINGKFSTSGTCSSSDNTNTNNFRFFTNELQGGQSQTGSMADFRYYNRVITAHEIFELSNCIHRAKSNV